MTNPSLTEIIEKLKSEKPKAVDKYIDRVFPCEPPCDSFGVCENCCTATKIRAGESLARKEFPTREELLTALQVLSEGLEKNQDALFTLLKRVTKMGEVKAQPHSPIDDGWLACDTAKEALSKAQAILSKKAGG